MQSDSSTRYLVWLGLGLMGVQFGVLARLTWWEYSWDIMEPVTYFVTYGTTMMCYAYYVLTKQEPNMPDVRDRQYLITFHKKAKRLKFDVAKYNKMKEEMYELEKELFKLRDPLMFHSPRKPEPLHLQDNIASQVNTNEVPSTAKDLKSSKC
uniref:Calcium uniporter protein n=1 Tax=Xenopsylla cheopis TaxID=163159 RepID=A0A6M2DZ38_XENCH